jgi:hypothetical protein
LAEGKRDGALKAMSAAADAEDMAKEAVAAFEATLERAEPLCAMIGAARLRRRALLLR